MIEMPGRFHTYHAPADAHNERDEDTIAAENRAAEVGESTRWIDPQGVHEVLGPGQTLREAADTVFGDAINEYNAKQTRADRKITVDSYLDSVEHSTRGRPVKSIKKANERARAEGREEDIRKEKGPRTHYESVLSLGNVEPLRGPDGKIVIDQTTGQRIRPNYVPADVNKAILQDYIAGWPARNPNLYLFRADFHADEWYRVQRGGQTIAGLPGQWCQGESHGHLGFIAFADGYQRGPRRQCSITKALAAMGYVDRYEKDNVTGKTRRVTAWEQWETAEREVIKEIARGYGYEIVPADDSREALSADEFSELADLKSDIQDARAELTETRIQTADLADREAAVSQREDELDAREAAIKPQEQELEAQRERLAKAVSDFHAQKQEAHDLNELLPRLRRQARDEEARAEKAKQEAETAIAKARRLTDGIDALQREEMALQTRIRSLQDTEELARKRGYEQGFALGAKDGEKSAIGRINAMQRADQEAQTATQDKSKVASGTGAEVKGP